MPAIVDNDKCTACATCVEGCPAEAIAMKDDLAVVDAETCTECGVCVTDCPAEAITLP